jgi:hypothetical protein
MRIPYKRDAMISPLIDELAKTGLSETETLITDSTNYAE